MSISVVGLFPRNAPRHLLTLSILVFGLVVLSPLPAHAFEKKILGDVVVERGEVADEVSTTLGDVTVNGMVYGDVRSAFGDIRINGEVGGNVEAGNGAIRVNAPVHGAVDAGFGNVYVNSLVKGGVYVDHGDVTLGPHAQVSGIRYHSGEYRDEPGSIVKGAVITGVDTNLDQDLGGPGPFDRLVGWVFATVAFIALTVLAAVLIPRPLSAVARRAEGSPGWSAFLGVASVPVAVVLFVVLAVSLIGIPLLVLLAPAYLALVFFGALVSAYVVGRRAVLATGRYRVGNALAAAVGAVILAAASLIPFIGELIVYGLALFGTGATVLALLSRRRPRTLYGSYEDYVRDQRDA